MELQASNPRNEMECLLVDECAEPKAIPLSLLKHITSNFSDDKEIGNGGFATVYKGILDNGMVAVKKLSGTVDIDDKKFKEEINCLMKVKHKNIVRFLGYCSDTQGEMMKYEGRNVMADVRHRLLCFEYLPQGSLDKQITDASHGLEWTKCYQFISGICDGLYYLQQKHILHLDLKPANILLDDNMRPKIADFGLSRCFDEKQSRTITSNKIGTIGYMPPEFVDEGEITLKFDIYSLGIIIMEILTRKKRCRSINKVLERWRNKLEKAQGDTQLVQVQVCTEIAIECINPDPAKRPDMQHIIDRLGETRSAAKSATETGASSSSSVQQTNRRETTSDMEEALIIERTEEKQKIVAILSGSITPEITVVLPIYGIGGIGKTTLAQLVFNDSQFAGYSRVWVCVSQNLDLNKIGNSILSQLPEESHIAEKQSIHYKLKKVLAGKKVLIVLDDVCEKNPDTLKSLKAMLIKLGEGSMVTIIVTTRDEAIAREICHTVLPYKLGILTYDICWKIIKQKTAFKFRVDKKQLKHIGKEIAIKCGGVALAAQSLGYILKGKRSDEWESVRDNYIWNESILEDPSSRNHDVLPSLRLSYSHMPENLKLCFSYCAVFSKGRNIVKYDLIHQWIALGLIKPSKTFDSMQLCERYVTQLLGMSFLEYSKTSSSHGWLDKASTLFTMHDLVHDLARAMLADKFNEKGNAVGSSCHYALLTDCSKPLQLSPSSENTRSNFFFNLFQKRSTPEMIKALFFLDCGKIELCDVAFSAAKCLHVLDLSECFIRKLPDSVGQLKQLRYLHAPRIGDWIIPSSITELSELNYLNLRGSVNISALPESIGDMKGLMHLDLSGCTKIRELPVSFSELKQLVHLDLSACVMPISEAFGGFTKLQYLNLSNERHTTVYRGGLLEIIGNLIELRYLNLSCWTLPYDQIGSLLGSICTFSNLEHLDLSYSSELSSIPESIGNLRKLRTMDLSGCYNLEKLPDSMDQMVSLKDLNVEGCDILDESTLPRLYCASLPHHFVVHASSNRCSSNIILLKPTNPEELMIDRLENVRSVEEAQSINLRVKRNIKMLRFRWTVAVERFVDDKEVLEKLVPPSSVQRLYVSGYSSVSVPDWLMGIRQYLPNLFQIGLFKFPKCNSLPPLGQLPNLQELALYDMESLEEWNTEGANKLMFPKLKKLIIKQCPKLKLNGNTRRLTQLQELSLSGCGNMASLPEWLGELTSLKKIKIEECEGIRSLPDSIKQLRLEFLSIRGCLALLKWCESEENKRKLACIKEVFPRSLLPLRSAVMNTPGFTKEALRIAISHLENTDQGSAYMSMHEEQRVLWLRSFLSKRTAKCTMTGPSKSFRRGRFGRFFQTPRHQFVVHDSIYFEVHASGDKCSSNISLLQPTNPVKLVINQLENVKSAIEAQSIKLMEKNEIEELEFQWTVAAGRFVDDKEVLEKLVPPGRVQRLSIAGYSSVGIPDWLMGIRQYLPNIFKINLWNFPNCNKLPPLGQLPNLEELNLYRMEGLQEWNTAHYSGKEGSNELMFPKLQNLRIEQCAKLRIKPCLPRAMSLYIEGCDTMLSSWGETPNGTSSSSPLTELNVAESKVPMHQWSLLHHLPALRDLTITGCSDLTTSPEIIHSLSSLESLRLDHTKLPRWMVELTSLEQLTLCGCASMVLPEWLGELPSLERFELRNCKGIRSLPDSIQQLTKLERLIIQGCPALERWCEAKENKRKLAHITEVAPSSLRAHVFQWNVHPDVLCSAVMTVPGFTEEALLVALSHLRDNGSQGCAYMSMHEEHRVLWLRSFLAKHCKIHDEHRSGWEWPTRTWPWTRPPWPQGQFERP